MIKLPPYNRIYMLGVTKTRLSQSGARWSKDPYSFSHSKTSGMAASHSKSRLRLRQIRSNDKWRY